MWKRHFWSLVNKEEGSSHLPGKLISQILDPILHGIICTLLMLKLILKKQQKDYDENTKIKVIKNYFAGYFTLRLILTSRSVLKPSGDSKFSGFEFG